MTRLADLFLGCSVCRQRGRHTSFCPRRPGFHQPRPAPLPPILLALLLVAPFWIGTFLVAGWAGIGAMLIVCGVTELLLFAAPVWWDRVERRRRARATRVQAYREEVVGSLYPREMRHVHRRKGVCTGRCRPKDQAA